MPHFYFENNLNLAPMALLERHGPLGQGVAGERAPGFAQGIEDEARHFAGAEDDVALSVHLRLERTQVQIGGEQLEGGIQRMFPPANRSKRRESKCWRGMRGIFRAIV
jgi:hypothetical protein